MEHRWHRFTMKILANYTLHQQINAINTFLSKNGKTVLVRAYNLSPIGFPPKLNSSARVGPWEVGRVWQDTESLSQIARTCEVFGNLFPAITTPKAKSESLG